jgi:hypothetical protein
MDGLPSASAYVFPQRPLSKIEKETLHDGGAKVRLLRRHGANAEPRPRLFFRFRQRRFLSTKPHHDSGERSGDSDCEVRTLHRGKPLREKRDLWTFTATEKMAPQPAIA